MIDPLVPVDQLSLLDEELVRRTRELPDLALDIQTDPAGVALARATMFERWPELVPGSVEEELFGVRVDVRELAAGSPVQVAQHRSDAQHVRDCRAGNGASKSDGELIDASDAASRDDEAVPDHHGRHHESDERIEVTQLHWHVALKHASVAVANEPE
jgi:hypothetical protein